ncbi:MAG: KamA family radical SAM protein [Bdellovibrionales bacterium]|nr:KamA family radical SAM protein [Bdellovibrionales bacterium]
MKFEFPHVEPPPGVSPADWNSSSWQFKNSLKNLEDYQRYYQLTDEERAGFSGQDQIFRVRTTPYYAQLGRGPYGALDPIRKILMPSRAELTPGVQHMLDPLGERKNNPVSRIIHRYPDRVLFLVTDFCSVYCRYCTRKHFTGQDQVFPNAEELETAFKYLQDHKEISEVILSGGDPLTLSNSQLSMVLRRIRKIEHIEIIRIGTRIPVVAPMRIDEELLEIIKRHHPIYMMTHFNHPRELTQLAAQALTRIVDRGIPTFNQMVLLNGVNNHANIVRALSRRLLYLRVKPYYMFQCDPSEGTDHFRTSIEDSENIQRQLWGSLSGLAMPNLSLDIPNGGGKVGLVPDFEQLRSPQRRIYRGWDGVVAEYVNPEPSTIETPVDFRQWE